jgi:TetR/AcrR family transcriptional repressor of nem operon
MPRTKQFKVEEAVTKAMHVFWKHGYRPTSMQDLVDCMGIGRGSIYDTFGSKRGLFLQALRFYIGMCHAGAVSMLAHAESPLAAISNAFENAVRRALEDSTRNGCFLVNTALELSPHDREVADLVAAGLTRIENGFRALIEQGQNAGEISRSVDPGHTARSLLGLMIGLQVLARSRPEESLLRAIKHQAEALLQ